MKKQIINIAAFAFVYFASLVALTLAFSLVRVASAANVKMIVQINPSGHALVRGTVDSIGTNSVAVKSWGGVWNVKIDSTTRILSNLGLLTDFKVGDFVGISGNADASGEMSINAKILRNWETKAHQRNKGTLNSTKTVTLSQLNNSGASGTATLRETDGKIQVKINLTGGVANADQPAHIHVGTCPGVGAVKYPLNSVLNGKSETIVSATMSEIMAGLPLAINVHKSTAESNIYIACGEIRP